MTCDFSAMVDSCLRDPLFKSVNLCEQFLVSHIAVCFPSPPFDVQESDESSGDIVLFSNQFHPAASTVRHGVISIEFSISSVERFKGALLEPFVK